MALAAQSTEAEEETLPASALSQIYDTPIDALELSGRVHGALERSGTTQIGQILEVLAKGKAELLAIPGIGPKSADELVTKLRDNGYLPSEAVVTEAEPEFDELPEEEEATPKEVGPPPEPTPVDQERAVVEEQPAPEAEPALAEEPVETPAELTAETAEPVPHEEEPLQWEAAQEEETEEEEEEGVFRRKAKKKQRQRDLIYDEEAGRVVSKRRRKASRRRPDWEDEMKW
jgi:hypothetical protein